MKKNFWGVFLLIVLMVQTVGMTAVAAELPNEDTSAKGDAMYPKMSTMYSTLSLSADGILSGSINLSYGKDGLRAEFSTTMTKEASIVGVKDIKIYKDVWYGWSSVITSNGGYDTNKALFGYSILYRGAEAGDTYKASCVHYGTIDGVSYELPNETSGFTCVDPNN